MTRRLPPTLASVVAFEDRNIVLTGFMGTGKSTIGRRLAGLLGFEWIDTDRLIERRHGPIADIFTRQGEAAFRGIERDVASELAGRTRHVFSTGGRMLLDPVNITTLSRHGRVFCLVVDADILVARLLRSPYPRPLLAGPDPERTIRDLLDERSEGYLRFTSVDSGSDTADAVARRLHLIVTAETRTDRGRTGHAVLPDTASTLDPPVTVLTDPRVGPLHGYSLGPVDRTVYDVAEVDSEAAVLLGGSSVMRCADDLIRRRIRCVLAPTTPRSQAWAMTRADDRVVVDLATLQTLPATHAGSS